MPRTNFNISVRIDDAKIQQLVDAINWHDPPGNDETGNPIPDRNVPECKRWLAETNVKVLKDVYKRYQEYLRDRAQVDTSIDIDAGE
jgi:hypothetical protein